MAPSTIYTGGEEVSLAGGMQIRTSDYMRKSDESIICLNVHGDAVGSLTKRPGYTIIGATGGVSQNIIGLQPYYKADTTRKLIRIVDNNNIQYSTGGAWTTIVATPLNGAKYSGEQFLDKTFFVGYNSTSKTFATNFTINGTVYSTGDSDLIGMPQAKYVKLYKDLLYVANVRTGGINYPSRVYFSNTPSGTAISWTPSTKWFTVPADNNEQITGLEVNNDRLLIFKEQSLYRWDESNLVFVSKSGCPNGNTIFTSDDGTITFYYSLNGNGIMAYTGGKPKLISQKIEPIMDALDKTQVANFYGCGDANHYYLYVGDFNLPLPNGDSQLITNAWIVYLIPTNSFYVYSTKDPVRFMSRFWDDNNTDRIFFGNSNGEVFKMAIDSDEVFSDNSSDISMQVRWRSAIGVPHQTKVMSKVWPLVDRAQGMLFRARKNNGGWTRDVAINENAKEIPLDIEGKVFELEVSESSSFAPPILNGFAIALSQRESKT